MALRAYPNPDRIACPGRAALEEVASVPISSRHPVFQEHVSRCSPCLAELLEIRRANFRDRLRVRRKRWILAACAAAILLASGITFMLQRQTVSAPSAEIQRQPVVPAVETARLDLGDQTGLRSDERGRKTEVPHELPRKRLNLSVILPFGSPPGQYQLGLFRLDQTSLTTTTGDAQVSQGTTILSVQLDLSGYPSGQYLVGVKRTLGDWTLHELTIR